ncbi:MAG TPA: hypothetical protein VHZ95_14835 [Polyangiales bacterium]|nr:hypothetical protein [Polyangiales bacterium]
MAVLALLVACGSNSDSTPGGASGSSGSSASAGSGGGAAVAVNCSTYCSLAVGMMCTGTLQLYSDAAACQTGCAMIKAGGTASDAAGDTLGCRIYHLTLANSSAANSVTHCPHGAVVSAVCN